MTYQRQQPVGRVTPGLRDAALIEYVGNDPAFSEVFLQAMRAAGFAIRNVAKPSGSADALILGHGLAGPVLDSHWAAVEALGVQARQFEAHGGTLILLQDTGGRFQPADQRAWRGGMTGLARTAAREFPKTTVRAIDIDVTGLGARPAADRIIEELLSGCISPCVGLSAAGRIVPADAPFTMPGVQTGLIGSGDVLLVTGGARGVTADCVIELARRTGASFALLGRSEITPWPNGLEVTRDERALRSALALRARTGNRKVSPAALNRDAKALLASAEIRQTLAAIEEAGGRGVYIPADVSQPESLRLALKQVADTLGPLTGLVHGAGVLADKMIREKTEDQVARVFAPKIAGLQAILSKISPSQLKTISFFSSVAARYGNAGQADYAMANEILNRVAHWLKAGHPDTNIVSLGWGPWDGGMVDDSLKARFSEMGLALIPRAEGANLFADAILSGASCPVELVIGSGIQHG